MSTIIASDTPFPKSCALSKECLALPHSSQHEQSPPEAVISHIPGNPSVGLNPAEVTSHLSSELETPLLDKLYDWLWLVARKSGGSIDTLHFQRIKGRTIVPCEQPRLHLVWHHSKVYIKPLPIYLTNYDFWQTCLRSPINSEANQAVISPDRPATTFDRSVAVGFIRSYAFLIVHQLDFVIAKESHLIPPELDWMSWSQFISNFRHIKDSQVSRRYHYGQLRLSRLNWVVRLVRPEQASTRWFYEIPHWSITEYVGQATIPLLFLFASISLALSSMQVALSVPADVLWFHHPDRDLVPYASRAFWVFSISVLVLSGAIWVLLFSIPLVALLWQLAWGLQEERERARARAKVLVL